MTQYIDKDALVAEIERRRDLYFKIYLEKGFELSEGKYDEDQYILSFLNTLEVKEVDLEEEINEWLLCGNITDTRYDDYRDDDIIETAKHFFELGMAVSNKTQKGE